MTFYPIFENKEIEPKEDKTEEQKIEPEIKKKRGRPKKNESKQI